MNGIGVKGLRTMSTNTIEWRYVVSQAAAGALSVDWERSGGGDKQKLRVLVGGEFKDGGHFISPLTELPTLSRTPLSDAWVSSSSCDVQRIAMWRCQCRERVLKPPPLLQVEVTVTCKKADRSYSLAIFEEDPGSFGRQRVFDSVKQVLTVHVFPPSLHAPQCTWSHCSFKSGLD